MKNTTASLAIILSTVSLLLSTCTSAPVVSPAPAPPPTNSPIPPTPTLSPTATVVSLPTLTLKQGEFYFSVNGQQSFIFSRNVAGYRPIHYDTFLDWSRAGGSKFVRIQLDSLGMGYMWTGAVDPNWVAQWDQVFDKAEADGIYILPVFSGWFDWNGGAGYSTWKSNSLNKVNSGPVQSPGELFQKGSATQTLWLNWMKALVMHWQGRKNILGWEIFSEVNLASGTTETNGIDFVNTAASIIRANDSSKRPVTASIADTGLWPDFYKNTSIDFINLHPYPPSAQLDRTIISEVRNSLDTYKRPLLIGESGLNAATPDSLEGKITIAPNAQTGIQHAIWAGVVSGAMNGRSLYWEDSFGIYFSSLDIPWLQKYRTEELPAANFVNGVDFADFKPLNATTSSQIWGAALGNDRSILGWFRDAGSEPPDWNLKPTLSNQTVTINIPGSVANWKVDFYDAKDGTTILNSSTVNATGNKITIPLPDFHDDIAFKAYSQ
jgi:hypothetical protein